MSLHDETKNMPSRVLNPRMLLINKGSNLEDDFLAKGRWIVGFHNDPDVGMFESMSPTAALLGHNLLIMVAVQLGWILFFADVEAAFL